MDVSNAILLVIRKFISAREFIDFELVISSTFFECRFGFFEMGSMISAGELHVSISLFQIGRTYSGPIIVMNNTKAATVPIKIP